MQSLKIVAMAVMAAIFYGLIHDQITIRICPEYFTVFHPRLIDTRSPTLLAAFWGVVATWWVGLPLGLLLSAAARIGSNNKATARDIFPWILRLLGLMACGAITAGIAGFHYGFAPPEITLALPPEKVHHFAADWWAHIASYASGIFGGLGLCILIAIKRVAGDLSTTAKIAS